MRVLVTGAAGFIGSHTCETILKDKRIKKLVGVDHLKDGSLRNLKKPLKVNLLSQKDNFHNLFKCF